jgi:hypothetical protein
MKKMVLVGLLVMMGFLVLSMVASGRSNRIAYRSSPHSDYWVMTTWYYVGAYVALTKTEPLPVWDDGIPPLPGTPDSITKPYYFGRLPRPRDGQPSEPAPTTLGDAFAGINAGPSASGSAGVSALDLVNDDNAKKEREEDTTPPGATTVPDGYYPEPY